jgi:hypothetical protein
MEQRRAVQVALPAPALGPLESTGVRIRSVGALRRAFLARPLRGAVSRVTPATSM